MSASNTTQHSLLLEVEALVAALMGDALPAEIKSIAERLEAAVDEGRDIPAAARDDIRSAIRSVRNGQPCAAVSALLTARVALGAPPR
ncbi:MAG TPA: hypothetical protein VGP04_15825 [Pseudonocardiaceae bacterium]|nr:hypothetical protein [Pseudonocardiaceae bacterium]